MISYKLFHISIKRLKISADKLSRYGKMGVSWSANLIIDIDLDKLPQLCTTKALPTIKEFQTGNYTLIKTKNP